MPLFTGTTFGPSADRAHRRALPGPVPGRAAAQPHRAAGGDPAVLRRVHGPGARAGGLERGDHRAAGRPARRSFHGQNAVYSYAIAWLVATVVQLLLIASALRRIDFRLSFSVDWRDPRVRQVLILFLPGDDEHRDHQPRHAFLNAELGTLVSVHAPSAINDAFRIYMLPQGVFSVAVATVLFPTLSRMASRAGPRRHAAHAGQRHPPDQPAADPLGRADGGAGHADHPAGLPARRVSTPTRPTWSPPRCSGSPSACPSRG